MVAVVRKLHCQGRAPVACSRTALLQRMGGAPASRGAKSTKEATAGISDDDPGKSGSSGVSSDLSDSLPQSPRLTQVDDLWDVTTSRLVDYSTLAFVLLLLPQLIKNAVALSAGNYEMLHGLAWQGFLTALMANTQLLGYFLDKGEKSAAAIQGIGVLSNYAVLLQVAVAGFLPALLTSALVAAFCVSLLVLCARTTERLPPAAWRVWQACMAVVGIITVPQVLCATFTGSSSLAPAALASIPALLLVVMDAAGAMPGWLQELWGVMSAWTATMLFCCQPIAQLASNFANPHGVQSLSLGTLALATIGNGMMVPRALYTKDVIWATGSLWGSLAMGLGNMLSLAVAHARFGIGNFTVLHFSLAFSVMVGYFSFVGYMHASARRAERSAAEQPLLETASDTAAE